MWSAGIGGDAAGEFSSVDIPDDDSYVYCAGTTQIWTATAGVDSGVLVQISSVGDLQWVRRFSSGSNPVQFNKVVVLSDHSAIYTFGNNNAADGIIVVWDSSGTDTLTITVPSLANIISADVFIDQSVIFFAGETSSSNLYVGALKVSDSSLILDKYFDVASTASTDISVDINGIVAIAGTEGSNGMIVNFDAEFNDMCADLTITDASSSVTTSSTSAATTVSSETLYDIFPTMVTDTFNSTTSTTTLTSNT